MSTIASWSYQEGPVTIWPITGSDKLGQPEYGTPYVIPRTDQMLGGDIIRGTDGTEFTPSITVFFEATLDSNLVPERQWYLKRGSYTSVQEPPQDAVRIQQVMAWPMDKFGSGEIPDWRIVA